MVYGQFRLNPGTVLAALSQTLKASLPEHETELHAEKQRILKERLSQKKEGQSTSFLGKP